MARLKKRIFTTVDTLESDVEKVVARGIGTWRRAIRAVIAAEFKCKGVKASDVQSIQCFREDLRLGLKDAFANASGAPTPSSPVF